MTRTLIKNAILLPMDDSVAEGTGDILIAEGRIDRIGGTIEDPQADVVDASGMIAMPGFVNAHIHTW